MDYCVNQLQIMLPVLGLNAFRDSTARATSAPTEPVASPVFHLTVTKTGVEAEARQVDGEFTLLPGSRIAPGWQGVAGTAAVERHYATHAARFQRYVDDGSIEIRDGHGVVVRPIPFTSPSAAGAVATGRSCNGRKQWVADDGTAFGEWEARGV